MKDRIRTRPRVQIHVPVDRPAAGPYPLPAGRGRGPGRGQHLRHGQMGLEHQRGLGQLQSRQRRRNRRGYNDHLEGYAWAENAGWIRLGAYTGGGTHTYLNTSNTDYGVNRNTGTGALSGYAWSSNSGWINFAPTNGGVTVSDAGEFSGYAWARTSVGSSSMERPSTARLTRWRRPGLWP